MGKKFKSSEKKYRESNFEVSGRPFSPWPGSSDYESSARLGPSKERCTYIDPETNRRCKMKIGIYPRFCHIHTTIIENLYIAPSNIENVGNGLFAGPLGFKKGDIIGEYSKPWMGVKSGILDNRNGGDDVNYSYVLCDEQRKGQSENDVMCWDGLDKNSVIVRNANDAHGSKYRNNAYFKREKDGDMVKIYMVAGSNIRPLREILCDYGDKYWD